MGDGKMRDIDKLVSKLKQEGFDYYVGVSCPNLEPLIKRIDFISSPREDIAIGLAIGAYLCGKKPCVLMSANGLLRSADLVINCLKLSKIPLCLIVDSQRRNSIPEWIISLKLSWYTLSTILEIDNFINYQDDVLVVIMREGDL